MGREGLEAATEPLDLGIFRKGISAPFCSVPRGRWELGSSLSQGQKREILCRFEQRGKSDFQ